MDNLIVTPSRLGDDADLSQGIIQLLRSGGRDLSCLDPSHPSFSSSEQYEILSARYEKQLIADGLESGHFVFDSDKGINIAIAQPLPIIAGYIFEAFTVRKINENKEAIGKQAFLWATERRRVRSEYLKQFHAGGVGHLCVQSCFPQLYNPTLRQFDVVFYRMNRTRNEPEPAVVKGTTNSAGIQIKAITGKEESEIIKPLRERKYRRVLTYLRHPNGKHSYEVCMALIKNLQREGKIDQEESQALEGAIASPEQISINQREVDEYYAYIRAWSERKAEQDATIFSAVGLQMTENKHGHSLITTLP